MMLAKCLCQRAVIIGDGIILNEVSTDLEACAVSCLMFFLCLSIRRSKIFQPKTCIYGLLVVLQYLSSFCYQVKSYVSMIVIEWAWFCNSVVLFIFNPLLKSIGLGPVFYIFGTVGILTGVFCMLFLPETKGLAVDEIQLRLLKKGNRKWSVILFKFFILWCNFWDV